MKSKTRDNKKILINILKFFILAIVLGVSIWLIVELFPIMKNISTQDGQIEFKNKIDSMGILGMLVLFGLQFAQIFFVVLPGEPLEILAGMCYGSIGGTLFIFATVFIITSFIVFLVKFLGEKFVYSIWEKEKIDKIKNSKVFKNPKKIQMLMIILFLIPGTPKDLLVYIGAMLPINAIEFILISTFVRFPSVISSTIAGANLAVGDFKMMAIVYGVTFIITGILIVIIRLVDKNAKEAIDIIK